VHSDGQLPFLVRRCQRGERAAFEELFRRFQPRLRYYVRRLDAVDGRTDDLLQDVWVKVVGRIGSLKDPKAFTAWLYTIARHEVYGRSRARSAPVELTEEQAEQVSDDELTFDDDDATRVHEALDRLKAHHREILTLSFMEDLSHEEIAEVLGIRAGTVKSRIHYAKQSLRRELEKHHE
jgi:RNA polymerase sigma-70 factor (ECF subfamily)